MKSVNNLKICLAGKNEIAIYGLKLLLKKIDKDNIYILTNSTDFGYDTWQPSLLKFAKENRLNLIDGPHVKIFEKEVAKLFGKSSKFQYQLELR